MFADVYTRQVRSSREESESARHREAELAVELETVRADLGGTEARLAEEAKRSAEARAQVHAVAGRACVSTCVYGRAVQCACAFA